MATRKMDSMYQKRKNAVPAGKSGKALSSVSKKTRDSITATYDDVGSGAGTVGAAASQPAALISSGSKDLNEGM